VREDPELDLRVVGRHELATRFRDERGPDLAAELRADGDRLEVRVRRRQAARRRDRLVEVRVQPTVLRRDQARQRLQVCVEQLGVLAPLLDHGDDLVLLADRTEHLRVRRVAGLALSPGREAELLEEHASDLLRRAEHELLARELVRADLELFDAIRESRGDLAHAVLVDLDPRVLHGGEHGGKRELDVVVQLLRAALAQPRAQRSG
jgi:hypothetical protein